MKTGKMRVYKNYENVQIHADKSGGVPIHITPNCMFIEPTNKIAGLKYWVDRLDWLKTPYIIASIEGTRETVNGSNRRYFKGYSIFVEEKQEE